MDEGNFYTYKDGNKVEQCKKCMTMHIDNYNPETFLWLLEKMDVPYVEQEWNVLRDRAAQKANQDHKTLTGMSIFGKYLSKMKLKQWNQYGWEDSEKLQADKDYKTQKAVESGQIHDQAALKEMFEAGEISEAEYLTLAAEEPPVRAWTGPYPINNPFPVVDIDIGADLTEEDMKYLAMKWGRLYRPDQWIALEKMWTEMQDSFDIQGAIREDQVLKICKTSLKMDEALDVGDVDTYQKLTRMYDVLTKAGRFTEAQNKDGGKGYIDSVGELVAMCEKEGGFIPRFITDTPQDKVDKTIQDINKYTYNLVTKDMGLAQQIEDALKKIEIQKEMESMEEELMSEVDEAEHAFLEIADEDYEEFYDEIAIQKEFDLKSESDE